MSKEFKKFFEDLKEDPVAFADKLNDENYKKILPEKVYNWHKCYKGDKLWSLYIIDVLIEDFQINNSDIGNFG